MCGIADAADLYVARNGNDGNPGTHERPLATLAQARHAVRELKEKRGPTVGPITVWLVAGTYELAAPFQLDERDGGTANSPVTYRAEKGAPVSISGGKRISADRLQEVRDATAIERLDPSVRDKVRCCDLASLDITDLGEMSRAALNGGPMLELFIDGRAMPMARWPNKGWATYGKVIDRGSIPRFQEKPERPGTLEYTGDRPERWTKAEEIWLHGYWAFDWYDDILKVKTLDTTKRQITFTTPHMYGLVPNRRYAALNLIEEIDTPGEWVLDRRAGALYLYPPGPLAGAQIVVSMVAEPLFTLTRTSYVTIRDLTFEYGRDSAVVVRGGVANLIAGCTVRNMGTSAIDIEPAVVKSDGPLRVETGDEIADGRRNRVVGCDIYGVGTSGISISGGDRRTLAPAGHEAVNNDVHHYSRRKRTNCPAISLAGVGNRAAHNFIHDAPHMGLFYSGNDHVIEFNEFCRLCWETGDVGVIYSGRDWTFRGNVVRYNFIHHTIAPGRVGSMGVYLDDSHSSTHIYGNVFYKTDYGAFIGGGRDNVVENNVFVDCRKAVHLDNRSQGWAHQYQKPGGDHRMYGKLKDVRHDKPPYATRYPKLATILTENPHE
ncbi:MAG: right-handed parallel beta-helix repeat-containing protein, partial [Planctomycetes bacterium]|nr:right-handed parallel beta-helix repeat-containing protein [Planctomycetota bacterium]